MRLHAVPATLLFLLALLVPVSTLLAQEDGPSDAASVEAPEEEEKEDEEKEDDEENPLEANFFLTSEGHTMNNLDLRALDESSDQDIIETDDRATFAYTGIAAELEYEVLEDTEFNFAAAHSGLWGNDQLGGISGSREADEEVKPEASEFGDRGSHFLWIYELSASWEAIDTEAIEIETTIGRQDFGIGGVENDFFFDDTIDGITIEVDVGEGGTIRLLPLDFYASNASPEDVDFVDYAGRNPIVAGFRGDTNTMRFGGVYENTKLLDGLDVRAFGFYADIGASTRASATGADRTFNGDLGNFSDHDYSWMAGTRVAYDYELPFGSVGAFGEYARSGGIDRKDTEIGLRDVRNDGNAFGGGIRGRAEFGELSVDLLARYFHADGGVYGSEAGVQSSHGFVSFKGSEVGGLNLERYLGFHPSAYVSVNGIEDHPNEADRKSGTEFIHGSLGLDVADKFRADFGAWYLFDTSTTFVDEGDIDEIASDAVIGYEKPVLEAQQRFGEPIGLELNSTLLFRANEALNFYAKGGVFLPSTFYEIPIERSASRSMQPALGSEDPKMFWAVLGGTSLKF